jgi:hypothetical protein
MLGTYVGGTILVQVELHFSVVVVVSCVQLEKKGKERQTGGQKGPFYRDLGKCPSGG